MATANRLLGCPASFINDVVKKLDNMNRYGLITEYDRFVEYEINQLTNRVVNSYSIKDCENVIISQSDFIDALLKSRDITIDINNKVIAARVLALPYVKKWISNRIHQKLFILKSKRNNEEHNCSICFESISSMADINITPCGHVFHNSCIRRWNRKTCPMCRGNL